MKILKKLEIISNQRFLTRKDLEDHLTRNHKYSPTFDLVISRKICSPRYLMFVWACALVCV